MKPFEYEISRKRKPILLTELREHIKTLFNSGDIEDYLIKGEQQIITSRATPDYFKVRITLEKKLDRPLLERQHVLDELVDEYLEVKGNSHYNVIKKKNKRKSIPLSDLRSHLNTMCASVDLIDYLIINEQQKIILDYNKISEALENKLDKSLLKHEDALKDLAQEYMEENVFVKDDTLTSSEDEEDDNSRLN